MILYKNYKKLIFSEAYLAQLVEHPSHTRIVTSSSLVIGSFIDLWGKINKEKQFLFKTEEEIFQLVNNNWLVFLYVKKYFMLLKLLS